MEIAPIAIALPAGVRFSIASRETAAVGSTSRMVFGGRGSAGTFVGVGLELTVGKVR